MGKKNFENIKYLAKLTNAVGKSLSILTIMYVIMSFKPEIISDSDFYSWVVDYLGYFIISGTITKRITDLNLDTGVKYVEEFNGLIDHGNLLTKDLF